MDKIFIVVFGRMMVKWAEELWSVLFCCQNFEMRSKPKKGVQSYTTAYQLIPESTNWYLKAWIQLRVIENELQNTIGKFLQGL
jgi:hypothetical protein